MPRSNFPRSCSLTVARHNTHHLWTTSLQSTPPPPENECLCSFSTLGCRRTRCACEYLLLFNLICWPQQNLHDEERCLSLCRVAASTPSVPSLAWIARRRGSLSTHPSLARNTRRRGVFFCRHTTNPSLAWIARREGLSLSTHPSLARNARQRGYFFCRHTTTNPSLAWIARWRGSLCQHTPPSLETRDGGGVSFVDIPPPTPPLLELQDRGVLSVNTPLPRSKCETEGVFLLLTHHQPLPRLNCETEGFLLSTRHHQPLPLSNCKMEGFSLSTHPSLARNVRWRGCFFCRHTTTNPSLARIVRWRGFFCWHATTNPSLARNVRWRGCFFCRCTTTNLSLATLPHTMRQPSSTLLHMPFMKTHPLGCVFAHHNPRDSAHFLSKRWAGE